MRIFFNHLWYRKSILSKIFLPLSWIYLIIISIRRYLYQHILPVTHCTVPVIIIGNITVGGVGKTPFVSWLAQWLMKQGYNPGIISRGYKGQSKTWPCIVTTDSDPKLVGDEPVLLVRQTHCPVVVGPDRIAAAQLLLKSYPCNILISDDGLQHYALGRELEIAMVDGERELGNGYCLPAGPLREPISRLQTVDLVIFQGGNRRNQHSYSIHLRCQDQLQSLINPNLKIHIKELKNKKIHAVAGIGNPERFFKDLTAKGVIFTPHIFPDHHFFKPSDIDFEQDDIVIMAEKDAIKCYPFADSRHWFLPLSVEVDNKLEIFLRDFLVRISVKNTI